MADTKHGLWKHEHDDLSGSLLVVNENGATICEVFDRSREDIAEHIAAAPETAAERGRLKEANAELLEALDELVKANNAPKTPHKHININLAKDNATKLIKKAKGTQND